MGAYDIKEICFVCWCRADHVDEEEVVKVSVENKEFNHAVTNYFIGIKSALFSRQTMVHLVNKINNFILSATILFFPNRNQFIRLLILVNTHWVKNIYNAIPMADVIISIFCLFDMLIVE